MIFLFLKHGNITYINVFFFNNTEDVESREIGMQQQVMRKMLSLTDMFSKSL